MRVLDAGASAIDGPPIYQALFDAGAASVLGFEPDPDQYRVLTQTPRRGATYLPDALGDGGAGVLRVCQAPGMTSMLEPDAAVLSHFHHFAQWGTVLRRLPMPTRRLDDVPEAAGADFLKLDVQGGELAILRGAGQVLQSVLVVHTEVQFVPFYQDQPLFAELDQELRRAGFYLHRFAPLVSRVFQPMVVNNDPYAGMSQVLWSDAVYIRKFTEFARLPRAQLLKIALVAHDLYGSFDLAHLALQHAGGGPGTGYSQKYMQALAADLGARK